MRATMNHETGDVTVQMTWDEWVALPMSCDVDLQDAPLWIGAAILTLLTTIHEAEGIAQHPEHRRVAGHLDGLRLPVHAEGNHGSLLSHGAPLRIQRRTCSSNAGLSSGGG